MPNIIMPNGTKIFIQAVGAVLVDTHFSTLLSNISSAFVADAQKIEAIRSIGALGALGKPAIVSLSTVGYVSENNNIIEEVLWALKNIDVGKRYHLIEEKLRGAQKISVTKPMVTTTATKKISQIDIVQTNNGLDKNMKMSRKCNFCEKETIHHEETQRLTDKLCAPTKFYCNFCLRNGLHTKDSQHTLILTFRSILGYFYYELYQTPKIPKMYLCEIQDHADLHESVGLLNPVFNYDRESFVWFIDFMRVGDSKKKVSVDDVKTTIIDILASFNLWHYISGVSMHKFYQKFREAVDDFYQKRYRPDGKKLLCPTLKNCGFISWGGSYQTYSPAVTVPSPKLTIEDTRNFHPQYLDSKKYWKKTAV